MKSIGTRRTIVGLALALGTVTAAAIPAAAAPAQVLSGYQCVSAETLTLWNAPSGGNAVGTWVRGTRFSNEGIDGSRFATRTLNTGVRVWVDANPAWSYPC
ncbi:hypothetical protein GCM10022243_25340 [Saccharothrix violaceirubra]|uniref:Ig-like domain-containing protein n=1 Tax=Saccharothrix violaceirubra TaxID=413306 RepID=A0A7W7SYZ0_9PSEU|nr:hypothetical protein [Saccharothrix violaceirubra]MBB4963546.1 hypothetical protein [Saccharothrix violaceirubra]